MRPHDGVGIPFYIQDEYPAYDSPIRVASKVEADYIRAEAGTTSEQLAVVQRERAANGQPAYAGPFDPGSVLTELTELTEQRSRDLILQGQHFGDWRRNPASVLDVPATGTAFFKPGFAPIGSSTCYPLPVQEVDDDPNVQRLPSRHRCPRTAAMPALRLLSSPDCPPVEESRGPGGEPPREAWR